MTDRTFLQSDEPTGEPPLESWKEIAAYLQRGVRTVKRWEKWEGAPVRRHRHQARSSVYAYRSELDAWRATRRPADDAPPQSWLSRQPLRVVTMAAMLLVALSTVGDGRLIDHVSAASQPAADVVARRVWAGSDVDTTGGISPDGRLLTFVDWTTGDLAVRNLVTGENRHLTHKEWEGSLADSPEEAFWSIVSANGTQVAYAWQPNRKNYDLRLVGLEDGAKPRVLYADADVGLVQPMDWSQDGRQILALFTRTGKTNQIVLVSVADGSVRVLKSLDWRRPGKMSLSHDGLYAAYDFPPKETSGERDIFILATDGSRETALVQHAADDHDPIWAPEGDRVLFVSDRTGTAGLWSVDVSQGRPRGAPQLVKADVGRARALGLTRGRALYYGRCVVPGRKSRPLLGPRAPAQAQSRGRRRPGAHHRSFGSQSEFRGLARRPVDRDLPSGEGAGTPVGNGATARELVRLAEGEDMSLYPGTAWTPDGRHVLFTKSNSKGGETTMTLWSVPVQGGEAKRIDLTMPLLRDLRVHPGGARIAFAAGQDKSEVWVMENLLRH